MLTCLGFTQSFCVPGFLLSNLIELGKFLLPLKINVYNELDALNTHVAQMRADGELLNDTSLADLVLYVMPYTIDSDSDGLNLAPWSMPGMQHLAFGIISVCDLQ